MTPYVFFYLLIFIFTLISYHNLERRVVTTICYILATLFLLLIAFRGAGYDFYSYLEIYENVQNGDEVFGVEPFFLWICDISPTFRILLVIIAILTIIPQTIFICKVSELPIFSFFLLSATFLLPTFMGQIRQGVSLGLISFAIYFLYYRKYHLFLIFAVIAVTFHFSALMSIILLFVPRHVKSVNYYLVTIIGSIFLYQFVQPVIMQVINTIPSFDYLQKILFYSENDDVKLGFNTAILIRISVLSLCYYYRNMIKSELFPFIFNIYHFSIIIYLIIGPIIPQLGGRGTLYFAISEIILIPYVIKAAEGYKKIIIFSFFILLNFFRIVQFFMDDFNYQEYVPYFNYYING